MLMSSLLLYARVGEGGGSNGEEKVGFVYGRRERKCVCVGGGGGMGGVLISESFCLFSSLIPFFRFSPTPL